MDIYYLKFIFIFLNTAAIICNPNIAVDNIGQIEAGFRWIETGGKRLLLVTKLHILGLHRLDSET